MLKNKIKKILETNIEKKVVNKPTDIFRNTLRKKFIEELATQIFKLVKSYQKIEILKSLKEEDFAEQEVLEEIRSIVFEGTYCGQDQYRFKGEPWLAQGLVERWQEKLKKIIPAKRWKKAVILSPNQMKNKGLVKEIKSGGLKIHKSKKLTN